jgi:hypothetical protein
MAGAVGPRPLARAGVAAAALADAPASLAALAAARPAPAPRLRTAGLVVAGAMAKSAGALKGGPVSPGAVAEAEFRRRRRAVERRAGRREPAAPPAAAGQEALSEGAAS